MKPMMSLGTLLMVGLFVISAPAETRQDNASDAKVRARLEPATAMPGQRMTLTVDVLGPDSWASLPRVPEVKVRGGVAYRPGSQSVRISETIEGVSHTGQRYEWWVFPRRTGKLTIEAFEVEVEVKVFGSQDEPATSTQSVGPFEASIAAPENAPSGANYVCTNELKVTSEWSDQEASLQVGDGVTWKIRQEAAGIPGMLLSPPGKIEIAGVQSYPRQPELMDRVDRGVLNGARNDEMTLIFEEPGEYRIPDMEFVWYDTRSKTWKTEIASGRQVSVLPNPDAAASSLEEPGAASRSWLVLGWLVGVMLLGGLGWRSRSWWQTQWRAIWERPGVHEYRLFRRLLQESTRADHPQFGNLLYEWAALLLPDQPAVRLDQLLQAFGDAETHETFKHWQAARYGASSKVDAVSLQKGLRVIRSRWKHQPSDDPAVVLPPLNPWER